MSSGAGFTLIEMLLVIALIGLFATLFVLKAESLVKQTATQMVEAKFWEAVREARSGAIVNRRAQTVRYDAKAMAFIVEEEKSGAQKTFAISHDDWPSDQELKVALKKHVDRSQHTLVAGEIVDLRVIPEVHFFPDGACTPFVASFLVGRNDERQIEIDPWTGAEMLTRDEK